MSLSEIQQLEETIVMQVDKTTTNSSATDDLDRGIATVVNRIPSTASSRKQRNHKRRHSFGSKHSGSNDGSTGDGRSLVRGRRSRQNHHGSPKRHKTSAMEVEQQEETFDKLDPSQPEHARRILQRRKAISKGKNTVGYQQYVQQVPKHQRHSRSMKTPSTPDPSLDIPAKRWQGLVKAWRIALHDYDPPELVRTTVPGAATRNVDMSPSDDVMAASKSDDPCNKATTASSSYRVSELEKAAATGVVLVDLDNSNHQLNSPGSTSLLRSNLDSPISVLSEDASSPRRRLLCLQDLDGEGENNNFADESGTNPFFDDTYDLALEEVDSDSDDELL